LRAQIEILAALQIIDREIREHAAVKQGLLSELQEKQRLIHEKKQEIETLTAACAAKEKLRQEKDKLLHEESQKATDKRMRMNRIKNVKELQALQREIDQIRQANGDAEEELLNMMVEIDGLKGESKPNKKRSLEPSRIGNKNRKRCKLRLPPLMRRWTKLQSAGSASPKKSMLA
jgi:predicted  nucleic acid-binding Zn-ribbon protein